MICLSGATCLTADCCFSERAICKLNSASLSRIKRTSSSSHWKLTCSRHLFSPWYIGKGFMKGVNFSCLKISIIPYNSIFRPNFNDFSILITIISGAYFKLFVTNECVGDVTIPSQVIMYNQSYSRQISQSDCSIRINYW
jgi:hypothetical protein